MKKCLKNPFCIYPLIDLPQLGLFILKVEIKKKQINLV